MLGHLSTTIGNIKFMETNNSTTNVFIIVTAVISTGLSILMLILMLITFKYLKGHCNFNKTKSFTNETVNMYASPAYGTHHVFIEPGLDHLYEPIDEEKSTTLQDAPAANNDDTDADGYLKMKSSCEFDDHAVNEGNVNHTGIHEVFNEQTSIQSISIDKGSIVNTQEEIKQQANDSDYENEDLNVPKDAGYLELFHHDVNQNHLKFSGNATLV